MWNHSWAGHNRFSYPHSVKRETSSEQVITGSLTLILWNHTYQQILTGYLAFFLFLVFFAWNRIRICNPVLFPSFSSYVCMKPPKKQIMTCSLPSSSSFIHETTPEQVLPVLFPLFSSSVCVKPPPKSRSWNHPKKQVKTYFLTIILFFFMHENTTLEQVIPVPVFLPHSFLLYAWKYPEKQVKTWVRNLSSALVLGIDSRNRVGIE